MKKILLVLLLIPGMIYSQSKIFKGQWLDDKVDIKEITVINRGKDPKSICEDLSFELALAGIKSYSQTNFGEQTKIDKESISTNHAITFNYIMNGYRMLYKLQIQIYDVNDNGRLIGMFKWGGVGQTKKGLIKEIVQIISTGLKDGDVVNKKLSDCGEEPKAPAKFNQQMSAYKSSKKYKDYKKELQIWEECMQKN